MLRTWKIPVHDAGIAAGVILISITIPVEIKGNRTIVNRIMSLSVSKDPRTPVLLLKTKSVPTDHYEELFGGAESGYEPSFLPVLEHRFRNDVVTWLEHTILNYGLACRPGTNPDVSQFGGLIFTSQRAVEAFTSVVEATPSNVRDSLLHESLPLYAVGPATARGVRSLGLRCPVIGEETGNGEALAAFMLDHYNGLPESQTAPSGRKLPLLFLVGEQRRDIIPKTLQSLDLADSARIGVDERIVYETGEMESFHQDFSKSLKESASSGVRDQWVVVFSPQGCRAMLRCLGWLDESSGRYASQPQGPSGLVTHIATIGPTTRNYLIKEFGFEPHISADKPSAEGIFAALQSYHGP